MTRRLSYINNTIFGRNGVPHFQCSLHGLARAASASVTARAHHFFCVAEFRDSICRLCDDPDAFHVFSFRSAGDNSLNWRLTADDSLYIHAARSLFFRTRQSNTSHNPDRDRANPTNSLPGLHPPVVSSRACVCVAMSSQSHLATTPPFEVVHVVW